MARMGRPLAMTVEDRKGAIYAAAEKLFGDRGYEKVTMSDIAAEAGMSKKTLYQLFADKEQLLRSLIGSSFIWPEGAFETNGGNHIAELRLRMRMIANHVLSDRHIKLCRLAIAERIGAKGVADAFLEMGIGKSKDSLALSIAKIERSKFVLNLPPAVLGSMLYGATCGYNLMRALVTGTKPDLKAVYTTIDQVIDKTFKE